MLSSQRSLPLPYHIFDLAVRQEESLGIQGDLQAESLFRTAQALTGLDDFGASYFRVRVEKLLASLENDSHQSVFLRTANDALRVDERTLPAAVVCGRSKKPFGNVRTAYKAPIVVTGLHRSGTTFLHRMLSLGIRNFGPPFWRLCRPFRLPRLLDLRKHKAWTKLSILQPIFPG